jgi:2-C-methyl-D-erythritol 2,4-cyclodiphosphate synthase
MRVGFGYDVHALVTGRPLFLGGVEIPHTHGLLGHSDADVLLHAICDALLGGAGLGDIGRHFPDSDPAFKGISSVLLLRRTASLLAGRGFRVRNVDSTVVLQKPKVAPYIDRMVEIIAEAVGIAASGVNVKATTTEHLGFAGREEGIAAYAVALVEETAASSSAGASCGV